MGGEIKQLEKELNAQFLSGVDERPRGRVVKKSLYDLDHFRESARGVYEIIKDRERAADTDSSRRA